MLCSFVACIDEGGNAIEGAGANFDILAIHIPDQKKYPN